MRIQTWEFLAVLVFIGALAWGIFSRLSSDAVSMALGVMFGVLAGVPTAILVLVGQKRRDDRPAMQQPPQYQPPVIVVTGHQPAGMLPHDVRHYFVPPQADDFYDVEPAHSREIVRRGGRR